ncbi:unnamed protein product [Chilo suppressalis]|uniref:FLYWCH-type domain-containing protein n=1 Tax=Chilo suppressalis TaxID=168631 RepID=A0ABN8ASY3_CHISP|nr:unnamed protein product [Chilo suppressalis]
MDEERTFTFIESQKMKRVLLLNGHRYNLNITNKGGSTLWRCSKRNECSASVTINKDENKIIRQLNEHTCKANFDKNRADIVMDKCKKLVRQKAKLIQIFFRKNSEKWMRFNRYPILTQKKTLFRARRKYLNVCNSEFENLNDLTIPKIMAKSFLVREDGCDNNKILSLP